MGFINSYKHLEKLCGEILDDDRSVSAYIDEMRNTPNGSLYVDSWDSDLKTLKHYRWIRNQIAHEPDCTEENMCERKDALWLDEFYSRIMNQTDPLSLYLKATRKRSSKSTSKPIDSIRKDSRSSSYNATNEKHNINFTLLMITLLLVAMGMIILAKIIHLS